MKKVKKIKKALRKKKKPRRMKLSTSQRRAYIFQKVLTVGGKNKIHQGNLAKQFHVSDAQISKDFKYIADNFRNRIGLSADLNTYARVGKCIEGLMKQQKFKSAGELDLNLNRWLMGTEKPYFQLNQTNIAQATKIQVELVKPKDWEKMSTPALVSNR